MFITSRITHLIILIIIASFFIFPIFASDQKSAFPGNNGQTGLWDMPNARMLPDWNIRLNYSYTNPYRYYAGTLGLFNRLEINGRITQITTEKGGGGQGIWAGYGDNKDKAVDFKLLLTKEKEIWPAIAFAQKMYRGTT